MSSTKVILKKSSVSARIPVVSDLEYGELALNYADGKLYYKKSDNTVDSFGAGGGGASNAFKTIAVSGQSDVVADSDIDTLTIAGTGLIAVTTNPATDTITIGIPAGIPFFKTDGTQQTLNPNVSTGTLAGAIQALFIPFTKTDGTDVTTLIFT